MGSQIVRHARFLAVDDTLLDRCSRRHCSDVPLEDRQFTALRNDHEVVTRRTTFPWSEIETGR